MSSIELHKNWSVIGETVDDTIKNLDALQDSLFSFGISYLDDALHGICRNDVILIGAPSGGGKTQLSTLLAKNFAKQGKRTWMFALEAMKNEISMRIAYTTQGKDFNSYSDFLFKSDKEKRSAIVRNAINELPGKDLIRIFYKDESFGISDLTREFYAMEGNCDVAILDYFQFVDLEGEKSEIQEQRVLANEINRLQKILTMPVVIVAQFNKAFSKSDKPFPTLSDFYGTSSLTNMCTKAITLSHSIPPDCDPTVAPGLLSTLFYIPKFRFDGDRTKYFAVLPFNSKIGNYEREYLLCGTNPEEPVELLKLPSWAKNAKSLTPYD